MCMLAKIGLSATFGISLSALGQTVVVPQCFFWQGKPTAYQPDPKFAPMIMIPESGLVPSLNTFVCLDTPQRAAEWLAYAIKAAHDADPVTAKWINADGSNVMILVRHFGFEDRPDDQPPVVHYAGCNNPTANSGMQYFWPADNLIGYPSTQGDAYRHPFLKNATTGAPLRAWMVAFRDSFKLWRTAVGLTDNPSNYRWYFDMETSVRHKTDTHDIYNLDYLLTATGTTGQPQQGSTTIWNDWIVPGSPGWVPQANHLQTVNGTGKTLAELYTQMVVATAGTSDPWPANWTAILNPNTGIETDENRRYILWYYSIVEGVRDAIMNHCAYSVLRDPVDGWPAAKCGNYNSGRYDAEDSVLTPTTTWFPDKSLWTDNLNPALPASWSTPQHLIQQMPRAHFDAQPSAELMTPDNVNQRWLTIKRESSGTADSPELYPLGDTQWAGNYIGQHGHWALNPYVSADLQHPILDSIPGWDVNVHYTPLDETKMQSRLRLHRHDVEAIINSDGGGHQTRLAPWVNQYIYEPPEDDIGDIERQQYYRRDEHEQRAVLAMLRAKNTPELLFWFTQSDRCAEGTTNGYQCAIAQQALAWQLTESLVRRVWAARIVKVTPAIGTLAPIAVTYQQALEFTLHDPEDKDLTVPIHAGTQEHSVILQIEVRIPDDLADNSDFDIKIEGFAPMGTTGMLLVRQPTTGQFVPVPTLEGPEHYEVDTAAFALGASEPRPLRRTFVLQKGHEYIDADCTGSPPCQPDEHQMVFRIKHEHPTAMQASYFDLFQVIPVPQLGFESAGGPGAAALPVADLNADFAIDSSDVTTFTTGLIENTVIADMDADGDIDADDVAAFANAYAAGN